MGVSFRGRNHCSGDRGTAVRQAHGPEQSRRTPKSDVIMLAAPQRKVAGTTWSLCASPGNPDCWHGGGKRLRSHSGCGLEKRPPWPRYLNVDLNHLRCYGNHKKWMFVLIPWV